MARLGVTDPRNWSGPAWLSDLLPHLAYGAATSATLAALERPGRATGWANRGRLGTIQRRLVRPGRR